MIYQICQLNNIHLHIIHSNIFTFKICEYHLIKSGGKHHRLTPSLLLEIFTA